MRALAIVLMFLALTSLFFSLYRVPVANKKEEYQISGTMSLPTLQGTYDLLDQSGIKLNSGTWQVQKVP